jgi:hypothetical protein
VDALQSSTGLAAEAGVVGAGVMETGVPVSARKHDAIALEFY